MKPVQWVIFLAGLLVWPACSGSHRLVDPPSASATDPPGLVVIPPDSPKLTQIRVATVRMAELPKDEVVAPGKLEANPNRVSRVLLPLAGRITRVAVKLGDAVRAGQLLLSLESPDADAALSTCLQADGSVTQARATLIKAQSDFDRTTDLFEHNAVAKKEVLSAENALTQAKVAVEQAGAVRQQALRRLEILGLKQGPFAQKLDVRAPISGKVLEISVTPGEFRNDTTVPVMTIADLSTIWVSSDVPESYIRLIRPGEQVEISLLAYPGETFSAQVRRIADIVDPQTRSVKVQAELDNAAGRFRPEMYGNIRHTASTEQTAAIPAAAVIQGDDQTAVFVEQGAGRFQQTSVKVGKLSGNLLPVKEGLKPGDRIVIDGGMLLKQ